MMAWLCSSAVPSFEMIQPDMQILCSSLSLLMMDITTLTIDIWRLDVSSAWSCFQFWAWPNQYAAIVFMMIANTVCRLLMCLRLGSSLTIPISKCRTLVVANIFACIHVGGVRFASILRISLSTCSSHSQWPPVVVHASLVSLMCAHSDSRKFLDAIYTYHLTPCSSPNASLRSMDSAL